MGRPATIAGSLFAHEPEICRMSAPILHIQTLIVPARTDVPVRARFFQRESLFKELYTILNCTMIKQFAFPDGVLLMDEEARFKKNQLVNQRVGVVMGLEFLGDIAVVGSIEDSNYTSLTNTIIMKAFGLGA